MSHGKYARLKVILEGKFPFNYTYYTVAHKCRLALLGRRAYLFNVWKMRKKGHKRPRWSAGPPLQRLCPSIHPPVVGTRPANKNV